MIREPPHLHEAATTRKDERKKLTKEKPFTLTRGYELDDDACIQALQVLLSEKIKRR